jgi:hypothetical protein
MYLAVLLLVSVFSLGTQVTRDPSGHWEGRIQIPERPVGVTLDLARDARGVWIGSLSVPISTSVDVPLAQLIVDGASVTFTATLPLMTAWRGTLSADGLTISGTVSNHEGDAPFQLTRSGAADVKAPPPSSALGKAFEGTWEATSERAGKVTRVVLVLSAAHDGTARGALTAIVNGARQEIPVHSVTTSDRALRFESRAISAGYEGTLGADGAIAGEWIEKTTRVALTFRRARSGPE